MKKFNRVLLSLFALLLLLSFSATIAQDVTDEPVVTETPAATEAPTVAPEPTTMPDPEPEPIPTPEPGFSLSNFLTGVLTGASVVLASIFGLIGRMKNDKAALDAIEWLGKSVPIEALDKLGALGRNMRDAGEVIDKVTDGQPNVIINTGT